MRSAVIVRSASFSIYHLSVSATKRSSRSQCTADSQVRRGQGSMQIPEVRHRTRRCCLENLTRHISLLLVEEGEQLEYNFDNGLIGRCIRE